MPFPDILYVIGSLDLGGTERHISLIVPRLKARGWTPAIYCLARRGSLAHELEANEVEVIGPPFEYSGSCRALKAAALFLSCIKLFCLMLVRRPRIVHFFLPLSYLIGAPLAILAGRPIRIMSRRSLNRYQKKWALVSRIESRLHRHMSRILGNSQAVIAELKTEGCALEKLKLIYNGVDVAGVTDARSAATRQPGALIFIMVANLIPYKGHTDLIHALGKIAAQLPPWELWCVGRDDGLKKELENLAASLEISRQVKFFGQRTDVAALWHSADIGILCSHEEGFSNAILEAMAAGLPMIVTDTGGNAEAVLDGETGRVVPPRDPERLSLALLGLAGDQETRRRLGKNGHDRVQQHFSLESCVDQYASVYRELVPLPHRRAADQSNI